MLSIRWNLVLNTTLMAIIAVLTGLGVPPDEMGVGGRIAAGFVIAIVLRLPAALIERYLIKRRKRNAMILSHLAAVIFTAFVTQAPPISTDNFRPNPVSEFNTIVIGFLISSLFCLLLSAIVVLLQSLWNDYMDRSGRIRPPAAQINHQQRRLILTLNIILILFTSAMIAPSFAAQEGGSFLYGFFGGFFISAIFRIPGAFFDQYLINREYYRSAYITHIIASIPAVLLVVSASLDPVDGDQKGIDLFSADAAGSVVFGYVFLSSLFLGLVALIVLVKRSRTYRQDQKSSKTIAALPVAEHEALLMPKSPPTGPAPLPSPPIPFPIQGLRESVPAAYGAMRRSSSRARPPNAVRSLRKEIAAIIGIVTGIAGISGAEDIGRAVIGLILGTVCVIAVYTLSGTHDSGSPERAGAAVKDAYNRGKFPQAFNLSVVAIDRLHHFYVIEQFRDRQPSPTDTWIVNSLTAALDATRAQDGRADVREAVRTATHRLRAIASAIDRSGGNATLYREALDRLAEFAPDVDVSDIGWS